MKIRTSVLLFIILLSTSVKAQDTIPKDNKWFTEFLIANSSGFTIDLVDGFNLAVGRRIFKNTDLRILAGFSSNNADNVGSRISGSIPQEYTTENSYHRYRTGLDVLFRIRIASGLIFKAGPGFEYSYEESESSSINVYESERVESNYKTKYYSSYFRFTGSFYYNFTQNLYLFVQGNAAYIRSHQTSLETTHTSFSGNINASYDYKQNSFEFDNFFLGGGISF